ISLSVLVVTKAVLPCPPALWISVLLATWEIVLRDKPPCFTAFRHDTNQTIGGNCTDKKITWASRPDENLALQIDPVVITRDGNYTYQIVTSDGNFHQEYHLQVAPEVSLVPIEKGTAVCKEVSEKLAAQIFWTPEGDCVTEQEPHWGNGTVTVQSTCPGRADLCLLCPAVLSTDFVLGTILTTYISLLNTVVVVQSLKHISFFNYAKKVL
ncbi:hypothetical protein FD755_014124, partial [Muntiacus reevesi]